MQKLWYKVHMDIYDLLHCIYQDNHDQSNAVTGTMSNRVPKLRLYSTCTPDFSLFFVTEAAASVASMIATSLDWPIFRQLGTILWC